MASMSDIEELTKERRKTAAPKKRAKQGEKKAPLISCGCGSNTNYQRDHVPYMSDPNTTGSPWKG